MIQSTPPLDLSELPVCENSETCAEETVLSSSSSVGRFREMMREKPKKMVTEICSEDENEESDGHEPSPPSPFSLIQHEAQHVATSESQSKKEGRSACELTDETSSATREASVPRNRPTSTRPQEPLLASSTEEYTENRKSRTATPAYTSSGISIPIVQQTTPAPFIVASPLVSKPHLAQASAIVEAATQEITHIVKHSVQETTLTLDGPLFANTPLAGMKMTLREYSTAPLAFNIHFACAPHALNYLQPHLKTLATLFQSKRSSYAIHSIDADLGDGVPSPIDSETGDKEQHERG